MCLIYGANSRAQCWSAFAATNSPMIFLHKILLFWAAEIRIFGFASVLQDWVDVALKNFTLCWHHLNSWHLSWFKVPRFLAQVELSRTLAASPEGTWMCVYVCVWLSMLAVFRLFVTCRRTRRQVANEIVCLCVWGLDGPMERLEWSQRPERTVLSLSDSTHCLFNTHTHTSQVHKQLPLSCESGDVKCFIWLCLFVQEFSDIRCHTWIMSQFPRLMDLLLVQTRGFWSLTFNPSSPSLKPLIPSRFPFPRLCPRSRGIFGIRSAL